MPFDEAPEWKLLALAAANGTTGNVQTWLSMLTDPLGRLKDLGSSILADNASKMTEIDNNNTASGSGANAGQAQQAKDQTERDRAAEKQRYQQRLRELGGRVNIFNNQVVRTYPDGELGRTIDELEDAEVELFTKSRSQPLQDEEQEEERQAELERLERKVELLRGKRQRIESEIRDVEAELRALG